MRLARPVLRAGAPLTVALLVLAAGASAATWTTATTIATCAPASDPQVVFPFSSPSTRSGRGAILWLGGAPACSGAATAGTTLDTATLHTNDSASIPRAVLSARRVVGPLVTAGTARGQVVALAGDGGDPSGGQPGALLAEGVAGSPLASIPLGGPSAPVASAVGYIGDAVIASTATTLGGDQEIEVRAQRHFAPNFTPLAVLAEGFAPITALAVGMDFRADAIVVWAQSGLLHAQWVTNYGYIHPAEVLGPTGYDPQISAVLSDDNHAFVMWTNEPAPGAPGLTRIYLDHSGKNVSFSDHPHTLAAFTEPPAQRLTPHSLALVRVTPSEGVLAAWTLVSDGRYVVQAAGLTTSTVLPRATIAAPGADLRLAALATGPANDFVVVLESAPRRASGFDQNEQAILAARNVPGGPGGIAFGTPTQLAAAGPNSAPSVAIDPDSDRAVVAWQTEVGSLTQVFYAVRDGTGGPAAAALRANARTASTPKPNAASGA